MDSDAARNMIIELSAARAAKADADARLARSLREVARYLVHDLGMSRREAARQMAVSHPRVCKILDDVEWRTAC